MRLQHLAAGVAFAALACVVSWPLPLHLATHLPGPGIGDNVQFLWNFWWMRTAIDSGADFFRTPYLFAPFGVDLTLHTHTALPALAGATALGWLPLAVAHNLVLLASLFLNGFVTYVLAWRISRDLGASMLAGVFFAISPYVAAHLNGHFNLTSAWTLPLFALALHGFSARRLAGAFRPGLVLGLTAYIDYYYVVYQIALTLVAWAWVSHSWRVTFRGPTVRSRNAAALFGVLACVDLALLVAIGITGGFRIELGPLAVSARSAFNPLQAFWILAAISAFLLWRPRIVASALPHRWDGSIFVAAVLAISAVVAAPVLWHGAALMFRGEYVTQEYFWRSAPRGIDVGTLLLGHPFHGAWGGGVRALYERFGIDPIESVAWFGAGPVVLTVLALRRFGSAPELRYWAMVGAVFFLWALGPHLIVFGANTGLILPQAFLRYLPIVANARVPGRAIVLTYLAVAMIGAIAFSRLRLRQRPVLLVATAALLLLEFIPAPFPIARLEQPGIYASLADHPEPGALLELPAGTRDSFRTLGALDHRVLSFQMLHQRPIVGGVVSRLSPSIVRAYEEDPLLGPLLRISGGDTSAAVDLPDEGTAARLLAAHDIGFVMLNRERAPAELVEYVERVLPLILLAREGGRTLYAVRER
jgi:hypothetical protein